ncbi:MAG: CGNR zinc finger domain-containing protein [Mycetocola sp.]
MLRPVAPAPFDQLERLCNSVAHLHAQDSWATVAGVTSWLREHGIRGSVTAADAAALRGAREDIRDFITERTPETRERVNALAARFLGQPRITEGNTLQFSPTHTSVISSILTPALETLLTAGLGEAGARLSTCRAPECRWVFYDRSPAKAGIWCDMDICGARHKMATYRAKNRE